MTAENSTTKPAARPAKSGNRGGSRKEGSGDSSRGGRGRSRAKTQQVREYEQKIFDLARVTRVTSVGKRMSFRCALVVVDKI